jgi:hypothetical protein
MAVIAVKHVEWNPEKASHFVDLAYAKGARASFTWHTPS